MQLLASSPGTTLGPHNLALRTKVSHAAFQLSWGWHQLVPDAEYDAVAAEMLDDADRCNDLREMQLERIAWANWSAGGSS